ARVQSKLLYVGVAIESEQMTASRQIKSWQHGARIGSRISVRATESDWKQRGIDDAERVLFIEERLLIDRPDLQVMNPLDVGKVCPHPCVGELSILSHGLSLQLRRPKI